MFFFSLTFSDFIFLFLPLHLNLFLSFLRRILWEGIDVLTNQELREACQERGMQSVGLTQFGYKRQLQVRTKNDSN